MNRPNILPWLLLPALFLTGCSTAFNREWKKVGQLRRDEFSGQWEGEWRSAKHRNAGGRLQCVMTPIAPNQYHARFKASWMIFTSTYSTVFDAKRSGRELEFRGSENLGKLFGGVYTFAGRATSERFSASYNSSYDMGRFEMRRPGR